MSSQGIAIAFSQQPAVIAMDVVVNSVTRPALPKGIKKGKQYVLYRDGARVGLVQVFDIVKPTMDEYAGVWVSHDAMMDEFSGGVRFLKYVPDSTHPGFRADGDPVPEYIPGGAVRRSGNIYALRPRRFWRR